MVTGLGAVPLNAPWRIGLIEQELDQADFIVNMNPRHPLLPRTQGTAGEHLERRNHLLSAPAPLAKTIPVRNRLTRTPKGFRLLRFVFPIDT